MGILERAYDIVPVRIHIVPVRILTKLSCTVL